MFSTEDVREVLELFPPPTGQFASLPSLIQAASGSSFITLSHLQNAFERSVTQASLRIPISDLSQELDIGHDVITHFVHSKPEVALLSDARDHVVPKVERDMICEYLNDLLSSGVVSRKDYAQGNNIDSRSVDQLLDLREDHLIYYGDHVCSEAYETMLSKHLSREIDAVIGNQSNMDLRSSDLEQLPGSPPKWLVRSHFQRLVESRKLADEVFVLETPDLIRVQSKHLRANNVQSWAMRLLSGELAYIDLEVLLQYWRSIYDSIDGVLSDFRALEGVEVVETFALSERWISKLVDSSLRALHYSAIGATDVAKDLGEKIQHGQLWALAPGSKGPDEHRKFPERLYSHVERKVEQYIDAALAQKPYTEYHRFGTIVLTDEQYVKEREKLLESAKHSAATQWEKLQQNPEHEVKFTSASTPNTSALSNSIHAALLKEKPTQKACDDHFWSAIAALEAHNESSFAPHWSDRVLARIHIYNAGLTAIDDQTLRAQLADLLATYVQKDLVPDALSKARAHGLLLSRRTKKNISRLEGALPTTTDLASVLSTLDKFAQKQNIPGPTAVSVAEYKEALLKDLRRRMARLHKPADGPGLFLTLVVLLFAKHHAGVVYATGKYAPKLLRLLKGALETEEYARLERWKEGAKAGSLSGEDREGMRGMAEA